MPAQDFYGQTYVAPIHNWHSSFALEHLYSQTDRIGIFVATNVVAHLSLNITWSKGGSSLYQWCNLSVCIISTEVSLNLASSIWYTKSATAPYFLQSLTDASIPWWWSYNIRYKLAAVIYPHRLSSKPQRCTLFSWNRNFRSTHNFCRTHLSSPITTFAIPYLFPNFDAAFCLYSEFEDVYMQDLLVRHYYW